MKVILNYDEATGNITDSTGMVLFTWAGLNYESVQDGGGSSSQVDGEQLIRIMKIAANISDASAVTDL